jgi:hypothetical protein
MSWYCGSQETPIIVWSTALAQLWSTLAWLTMTPFGSLVDPDVYCKNRISPGSFRKASEARPRTSSVVIHARFGSAGDVRQSAEIRRLARSRW